MMDAPGYAPVLKTVDRYHTVARQVSRYRGRTSTCGTCLPGHVAPGLVVADVAMRPQAAPDGLAARVRCGFNRERTFSLMTTVFPAKFGVPNWTESICMASNCR
jgi:hypothetical protein